MCTMLNLFICSFVWLVDCFILLLHYLLILLILWISPVDFSPHFCLPPCLPFYLSSATHYSILFCSTLLCSLILMFSVLPLYFFPVLLPSTTHSPRYYISPIACILSSINQSPHFPHFSFYLFEFSGFFESGYENRGEENTDTNFESSKLLELLITMQRVYLLVHAVHIVQ